MTRPRSHGRAESIDRLRDDVDCLQCGYSLRGLPGDLVRCPECGVEYDVAQIIAHRWDKPWYRAPGFNRLVSPLTWVTLATILLLPFAMISDTVTDTFPVLTLVALAGIVVVWIVMLRRTAAVLTIASGPWLAILAHGIFIDYLAGIGLVLRGVLAFLTGAPGRLLDVLIGSVLIAVGCALFWVGRRGEKYIASLCIRQYLLDGSRA